MRTLKLTHPFRNSTDDSGDMRDRLYRRFAAALVERTGGELAVEIASDFAVRDTVGIFSALQKGMLDFSRQPLWPARSQGRRPRRRGNREMALACACNGMEALRREDCALGGIDQAGRGGDSIGAGCNELRL